ncbi:MAG: family 20 glycosylhydrolase [Chloroflexi bacterium]|nr:family 20 glycosylhydrolase [Chloroflexota bacterium]
MMLPQPQKMSRTGGTFVVPEEGLIALHVPRPADLLFTARHAQTALHQQAGVRWELAGGGLSAPLVITLDAAMGRAEGYRLHINADGILVVGHDAAGVFYGVQTLRQLVQVHGRELPCLEIEDWPDFSSRGVMLDVSRDKVPTLGTLYDLVDMLAGWKINQLQLYVEHTFAYRDHHVVWEHASPLTAEQILDLDAYCRARFIDLVPNQNSFGHLHRWFQHARYLPLAETDGPTRAPWGRLEPPFSLAPAVPATLDLLRDWYAELLPNFTCKMFNVGCDETFDLGHGRSRALVEQKGKGRVYLDFLLEIHRLVQVHERTMQFWGDIIIEYPDLVPELPPNVIALEWGYEADHDFPGHTRLFAESGVPFYVCPGTSSWTTIAGRTDNCRGNIRSAVANGLQHGAVGVLNTDWGDWGHWQPLPVSYLGFAYGAALSWCYAQNVNLDLPAALDTYAFGDEEGVMGRLAYDLGNVYQEPGILIHNGSFLFWAYHHTVAAMRDQWQLDPESQAVLADDVRLRDRLHATLDTIDRVLEPLGRANMQRAGAALMQREFQLVADLLRHGARRALLQLNDDTVTRSTLHDELDALVAEFRAVWLARNRPGGLDDSLARLERARALYAANDA